ncbi:diguanylate cyclase domain-containing protein [Agrobacterium sp. rho-8.1]|jgi:diguanylate cyclase (GGDEF)-like protein|nr:sensor domain-containing diguanylate cyclase [Agrobacterium sp. rho-8.1]
MKDFFARMANGTTRFDEDLIVILDTLPIPISWASIPDGHIRFVNKAFTRTFGYQNGCFMTVDNWIDETYRDDAEQKQARIRWETLWKSKAAGITEIQEFEINVRHANGSTVSALHRGIVLHEFDLAIAVFEDISAQKLTENVLKRIANEDPLTGLGNRRVLKEKWLELIANKDASRRQPKTALLMVDLDNFKPINDYYGHEAGDDILKMVAKRLRQSVRHNDTIVRMGGDEFVILLPGLRDQVVAERVCQRIATAFQKPFCVRGENVEVGATIGASLYPDHADNLDELLHAADQALYRMKRSQKNSWDWFDPSVRQTVAEQHAAVA